MNDTVDMVLHPPARLQIAAILSRVDDIEFSVLRDLIDVSDSVLSKHLSALSEVSYVEIRKAPMDGRQRTWARLSGKGRKAFASHMRALHELVESAQAALDGSEVKR